jgi:acyl-CoA synthetase (NDP forming)
VITAAPGAAAADRVWQPRAEATPEGESHADVESLRSLLEPASVAVVGASRRPGSVGRAIVHAVSTGGYAGRVYPVNPHARHIEGIPCLPSVAGLPEPADLAVLAVPPAAVAGTAEECGRRGVRSLAVITAGLDEGQGADLLAACRRHGMRLIGPDCFGVAVPGIGLDATLAAAHPQPGTAGLVMQSGGLGLALAGQLSRLGVGISSFVSVGRKYDVSGNDMLTWWAQDGVTRVAVLYLESFGNPRKFVRLARQTGQQIPVLALHADRPCPVPRPGAGRPQSRAPAAAAAAPPASREELFGQAGIIATGSPGELLDAAALLASQPVPAGPRVVIVSNVAAAAALAARACAGAGLVVHHLAARTQRRLRSVLPPGAVVAGPVYTTTTITEAGYRQCLEMAAADESADAVIAVALPTAATGDLRKAIRDARVVLPLAAVLLDQAEGVQLLRREEGRPAPAVPGYGCPENAVRALGHAAAYGAWRARPQGRIPRLAGLSPQRARALARDFLRRKPGGGWLEQAQAAELVRCYGIELGPVTGGSPVTVGAVEDPVFGPLVVLRPGNAGQAARLAPLTGADADELIRSAGVVPAPAGSGGSQPPRAASLRDILLRVSRLAADLPEIAELDLDTAAATPGGVAAVSVRARVAPCGQADPFLHRLR